MNDLSKWNHVVGAATLLVCLSGCVQGVAGQRGYSKHDDCLMCHTVSGAPGAKDLSQIYINKEAHHRVDMIYPVGEAAVLGDYNVPGAELDDVRFFDRNGNAQIDTDEVRLYKVKDAFVVTCSSCHREHERTPARTEHSESSVHEDYLRGSNVASDLCIVCHRK
jgi:hypothetical protein